MKFKLLAFALISLSFIAFCGSSIAQNLDDDFIEKNPDVFPITIEEKEALLVDYDYDGVYEIYRIIKTRQETETKYDSKTTTYSIDLDGDDEFDYTYNFFSRYLEPLTEPKQTQNDDHSGGMLGDLDEMISMEEIKFSPIAIAGSIIIVIETFFVVIIRRRGFTK